jgi:hypothetical protein
MHPEALHLAVEPALHDTPEWLHDRAVLLEDLFQLGHDHPALIGFENALRLGQQLVELRVRIARLIPRRTGAVGQAEYHHAEGPMGPTSVAERHLVPYCPETRRRHEIDFHIEAGCVPHLDHDLHRGQFPGRIALAGDFQGQSVGIASLRQ